MTCRRARKRTSAETYQGTQSCIDDHKPKYPASLNFQAKYSPSLNFIQRTIIVGVILEHQAVILGVSPSSGFGTQLAITMTRDVDFGHLGRVALTEYVHDERDENQKEDQEADDSEQLPIVDALQLVDGLAGVAVRVMQRGIVEALGALVVLRARAVLAVVVAWLAYQADVQAVFARALDGIVACRTVPDAHAVKQVVWRFATWNIKRNNKMCFYCF